MIANLEDLIFLMALLLPLFAIGFLVFSIKRHSLSSRKNLPSIIFVSLSLLINPLTQLLFLGPLDDKLNADYLRKANAIHLVGKTAAEVESAFGKPERVSPYKTSVYNGETMPGSILWEYKPLPGFWMGGRFQVSFTNGLVASFEGFDN